MSVRILDSEFLLDGVVRVSDPRTGMAVELTAPSASDQRVRVQELIHQLMTSREVPKIFVGRKENTKRQTQEKNPACCAPRQRTMPESPDPLLELIRERSSADAQSNS